MNQECVTQYNGYSLCSDQSDPICTRMGLTHVILDDEMEMVQRIHKDEVDAIASCFSSLVCLYTRGLERGRRAGFVAAQSKMREAIGL